MYRKSNNNKTVNVCSKVKKKNSAKKKNKLCHPYIQADIKINV